MALLRSDENDGVGADPYLQQDAAVAAEHGEHAALFPLEATKLHQ